jgi:hypothetical protein
LEFTSKINQQEKQEKTEETEKGHRATITEKRVMIWSFQGICIRHWLKRVTMANS